MRILKLLIASAAALGLAGTAQAAGGAKHAHGPEHGWTFEGYFGTFDQAQLQRGYKVYREVCAACHGMDLLNFRNLGMEGGPFYNPDYPNPNDNPVVKELAATSAGVPDIDPDTGDEFDPDTGDRITRPRKTSDPFPAPFPNEAWARSANGGALPPDLSVITKARPDGVNYLYSLLTGYPSDDEMEEKYALLEQPAGQYFNPYFPGDVSPQWSGDPRARHGDKTEHDFEMLPPGGFLAMAPPLYEDGVEFDDGTAATVEQMAEDVTAFLAWAAEPKAQVRKKVGMVTMMYLLFLTVLVYLSYKQIWRNVEH